MAHVVVKAFGAGDGPQRGNRRGCAQKLGARCRVAHVQDAQQREDERAHRVRVRRRARNLEQRGRQADLDKAVVQVSARGELSDRRQCARLSSTT